MTGQLLPLAALAPILIWVALSDLREMRIPNRIVLITLGFFALCAPFLGLHELSLRLAAGAITFLVGYVFFVLRAFGGGDVKFLAALMLFVPSAAMGEFLIAFSVALFAGSALTMGLQSAPVATRLGPRLGWKSCYARGKLPMGVSIALAGLALPYLVGG
ncbi:prepilin peptidase [Thioclava sp.]|uniref:A24 family peptidase n=1 Tax=Thioclava sp. TaxID=1933450 RepID=UPI003241CFA4